MYEKHNQGLCQFSLCKEDHCFPSLSAQNEVSVGLYKQEATTRT
jgi:hypothetical protein